MMFIAYFIGVVVGAGAVSLLICRSSVGTLRIDTSEPNEQPCLFLELKRDVSNVSSKKRVILNVSTESYIPQK